MDRQEKQSRAYHRSQVKTNYYVDGNTVRRLEGEPKERQRRREEKEKERQRRINRNAAKRNREKAMHLSRSYVVFCTLALIVTCGVCSAYIKLQSEITGRMRNIAKMESEVANLKADNDAALKRIDTMTDLKAVKEKALNELKMGYAKDGQIIYYSMEDDDFMNQFQDIPQN